MFQKEDICEAYVRFQVTEPSQEAHGRRVCGRMCGKVIEGKEALMTSQATVIAVAC